MAENIVATGKMIIQITTGSNVLVGGADQGFEIGGVDKTTVLDFEGKPYIPSSAFKGMLRRMAEEGQDEKRASKIIGILRNYLEREKEKLLMEMEKKAEMIGQTDPEKAEKIQIRKNDIKKLYDEKAEQVQPADIFGINGIQTMPKLLFEDFEMMEGQKSPLFKDTKNTIEYAQNRPLARPRTYQVIRKNITFQGEILFYNYDEFKEDAVIIVQYLVDLISQFNEGIYRIGNSKSRGYGKIQTKIIENE